MTSSRWQKTNELNGIFGEFFCLTMLCLGIVYTLQGFAFMLGFLVLCFYGITVCADLCVSA